MDESSALILKRYFRMYYFKRSDRIKPPTQMRSREFGYLPFGGGMIRHLSFSDIGTLRALLVKEAPAGFYCSNSLYEDPSAEMTKKGWLRANLIFDIDADLLNLPCKKDHDIWICKQCKRKDFGLRPDICPSCNGNRILETTWTCHNCLEGTKTETLRLISIIQEDLGIPETAVIPYFSGNAGYHVEIRDSVLDGLDQHGRAEISDYLSAQGIEILQFKSERLSPRDPGWRGRIAKYIRDLPPNSLPFKSNEYEERIHEMNNLLDQKGFESLVSSAIEKNSVGIDAMVTTDIHRIFRMPETLNNKTGLVKKECADILSFDPSVEAVALPEESEEVSAIVDMCPKVELNGLSFGPFRDGIEVKLPMYVAVYLIAKGAARIASLDKSSQSSEEPQTVLKGSS